MSFSLPPDSGERITLVVTSLLTMTVFMLLVAEIMPPVSDVVPIISVYYVAAMFVVKSLVDVSYCFYSPLSSKYVYVCCNYTRNSQ